MGNGEFNAEDFESSKQNDLFVGEYIVGKLNPVTPKDDPNWLLEFTCSSENSNADYEGVDVWIKNNWRAEETKWDTKYIQKDYIWFEKFKPHPVRTDFYFYVFGNTAFWFSRKDALMLCETKKYLERPGKNPGVILSNLQYNDLKQCKSFKACGDFIVKYASKLVNYHKLGILNIED